MTYVYVLYYHGIPYDIITSVGQRRQNCECAHAPGASMPDVSDVTTRRGGYQGHSQQSWVRCLASCIARLAQSDKAILVMNWHVRTRVFVRQPI